MENVCDYGPENILSHICGNREAALTLGLQGKWDLESSQVLASCIAHFLGFTHGQADSQCSQHRGEGVTCPCSTEKTVNQSVSWNHTQC